MVNEVKMTVRAAITELWRKGWKKHRIARELGVHVQTVRRYVGLASKSPISTAGSDSKSPNSTAGSAGRQSSCEPYRAQVLSKLEQGLSAQRIWQDLRYEVEYQASYESVKRFVRKLGQATPVPFRRMDCAPGEELQVDFGKGAFLRSGKGRRKRPHLFRAVLGHSRGGYSEVVDRQTAENFIRCIENAFWRFGGVTEIIRIDNLKAGVVDADWYDPELNPKLKSFCEHYGVSILPTRPYTPRHKGKVERGVGYVQDNALRGREFASIQEQNQFLWDWEAKVADTRIHGTTREQVGKVFAQRERPVLKPLPQKRFPFFEEGQRTVHRDAHVEVQKSFYSVPPEYLGRQVWVRWDSRVVRIYSAQMERIATHARVQAGRFQTDRWHIPASKISGVERGAEHLLRRARKVGRHTYGWAEAMFLGRGIEGIRPLVGLLSMVRRYSQARVEEACRIAHSRGQYRLKALRLILHSETRVQQERLLESHPLIRDLEEYEAIVAEALDPVGTGAGGSCEPAPSPPFSGEERA